MGIEQRLVTVGEGNNLKLNTKELEKLPNYNDIHSKLGQEDMNGLAKNLAKQVDSVSNDFKRQLGLVDKLQNLAGFGDQKERLKKVADGLYISIEREFAKFNKSERYAGTELYERLLSISVNSKNLAEVINKLEQRKTPVDSAKGNIEGYPLADYFSGKSTKRKIEAAGL